MRALGTLFAIFLTMSPVAIVNAQTVTQPTAASKVVTKSDVQKVQKSLSKQIAAAEARQERQAQQAEEQRKADEEVAAIRLSQQVARQAADQHKADHDEQIHLFKMFGVIGGGILAIIVIVLIPKRGRKLENPIVTAASEKSPAPEDLYGTYPTPEVVKRSLIDNKLSEGLFTIDLPSDHLVFEYRARRMDDGSVMAFFSGNERPVSLEHQKLRKVAKRLKDDGTLRPIELKSTGTRRVV